MNKIIRGTTPSIKFTFKTIRTSDITAAYLTVKNKDTGTVVLDKDLTAANVTTGAISWQLSQTETLAWNTGEIFRAMLNWKTSDGLRGSSEKIYWIMDDNDKNEVI